MGIKNTTVIMIMVDALRHDYINEEHAPFLFSLKQKYMSGALKPSFGFEPDGAYLAGLDPDECNGGAQYWKRPGDRVFYLTPLFRILDFIPARKWKILVRKAIRLVAQILATDPMTKRMAPPNLIPLSMLKDFSFPMTEYADSESFCQSDTIFDILKKENIPYYFHGHPKYKVKTDKVLERYLLEETGGHPFSFLFMGDLDGIGHRYGPDSTERKNMLIKVDSAIEKIYQHASSIYDDVELLIFGDHGMAEVKQTIDLRHVINKVDFTNDDSYFIDSTFARFWVRDADKKNKLCEQLNSVAGGHVLTKEEIIKYKIQFDHNYFGDIIFVIDENSLLHPSFYSDSDSWPLGMHGYLPDCIDNESSFIVASNKTIDKGDIGRVDMRRVFPTVLELLGLLDNHVVPHKLKSLIE